jgi:FKBP-type peptidyl-prolyl cis-trans isomerase
MRLLLIVVAIVFISVGLSAQSGKQPNRKSPNTAPKAPSTNTAEAKDRLAILQYAATNNYNVKPLGNTGIWYEILEPGYGPELNDTTLVKLCVEIYNLNDSSLINSNNNCSDFFTPLDFNIKGPISSLKSFMREATKFVMFIPANNDYLRPSETQKVVVSIKEVGTDELLDKDLEEKFERALLAFDSISVVRFAEEEPLIKQYFTENNLSGFEFNQEGYWYEILVPGDNKHPVLGQKIKINFNCWHLDGRECEISNKDRDPVEIVFNWNVIGWLKCLDLLGKGGRGIFVFPSRLSYGMYVPVPVNPALRPLVFEIELLDFK